MTGMDEKRLGSQIVARISSRLFYGWVVVVASLLILCTMIGVKYSFGIFFKSLQSEFGLSRAVTSGVFSVFMIFSAGFSVLAGWALDKYGPRLVVSAMGFFIGLSLLLTSQTSSLWQLFLSYSLVLAIGTAGAIPVLLSVISHWFDRKRGYALGIAGAGMDLGIVIMAPVATYLISTLGWQTSYIVIGLFAWFIIIPLSMLLRGNPRDIGAWPDGDSPSTARTEIVDGAAYSVPAGLSLLQATRTNSFWLLFFIWLMNAVSITLVLTHIVPYATDVGISAMEASAIVSIIGITGMLSRVGIGRVSDIVGRKTPGITCALIQVGTLIALIWTRDSWVFYLLAVAFGLSFGGLGGISVALLADVFGGSTLGIIMGATEIGFAIGASVGSVLGGFIFDISNSYAMAFVIVAGIMSINALLIALVGHRRIINTATT